MCSGKSSLRLKRTGRQLTDLEKITCLHFRRHENADRFWLAPCVRGARDHGCRPVHPLRITPRIMRGPFRAARHPPDLVRITPACAGSTSDVVGNRGHYRGVALVCGDHDMHSETY